MAIAAGEVFDGVNAVTAVPKLQLAIGTFGPQLIVHDSVEYGSLVAAELAKVPHARVAVHAISFEEAFPPNIAAPLDALRASVAHGAVWPFGDRWASTRCGRTS